MKYWALALMVAGIAQGAIAQSKATQGSGAVLRGLDKVDSDILDMPLRNGQSVEYGRLTVELRECRYPAGDAARDAYAYVTVRETKSRDLVFLGWMVASSPALNAMEHPRYDVWLMRCTTE